MKILRMEDKYVSKAKSTYIYLLGSSNWLLLHEIKNSTFSKVYDYLTTHVKSLDYMIMSINYLYRNMIYTLFPCAKVVISKKEMINFYESVLGIGHKVYEEAAITFHYMSQEEKPHYLENFIYHFYEQEDKYQALRLYEEWQTNIPLNNKNIYKILRTIECFSEEIFNYFDYKDLIGEVAE